MLNARFCKTLLAKPVRKNTSNSIVALTVSEETWKHKLGTIAHSVDSAVLDDQALVSGQESLQRSNDPSEVGLVASVVHRPLCVEHIVQSNEVLVLVHGTRAHTSQLLHVSADTKEETKMHTKGTDVGSGLAADPEDTEVAVIVELNELALVDCSDSKLTLDSGDQGGALEESAGQGLEGLGELRLAAGQLVVQADDAHVLLSGSLLGLDQSSGTVDANNQASGDLGVEGTTVASLLNSTEPISVRKNATRNNENITRWNEPKDALNPGHDLVTRRVGRLVEIDNTRADVRLEVALQRRAAIGDWGKVAGSHEN